MKKPIPNCSAPGTIEEQARPVPNEDVIFIGKLQAVYMDMSIAQLSLCDSSGLDNVAAAGPVNLTTPVATVLERTDAGSRQG